MRSIITETMEESFLAFEKVVGHHNDWVEHVCFNPKETLMATCCCEFLYLWNISKLTDSRCKRLNYQDKHDTHSKQKTPRHLDHSKEPATDFHFVSRLRHDESVWKSCFNAIGSMLFTACGDGNVYLWSVNDMIEDTEMRTALKVIKICPSPGPFGMAVSMVSDVIFTCDQTKVLTALDWTTGTVLATAHAHMGICDDVAVSPTGRQVATCSKDYSVALWSWGRDPTEGTNPGATVPTLPSIINEETCSYTSIAVERGNENASDIGTNSDIRDPDVQTSSGSVGRSAEQEALSDSSEDDSDNRSQESASVSEVTNDDTSGHSESLEDLCKDGHTIGKAGMATKAITDAHIGRGQHTLSNTSEDDTIQIDDASTSLSHIAIYALPDSDNNYSLSSSVTDITSEEGPNGNDNVTERRPKVHIAPNPVSDSETDRSSSTSVNDSKRCTMSLEHRLLGHQHWVFSVSYSPDGELLCSASADRAVGVWSTRSGLLLHYLLGHKNMVWSAIFVPSDQPPVGPGSQGLCYHEAMTTNLLVSCSSDFTVRVWDLVGSKVIETHRQLGTDQVVTSPVGKVKESIGKEQKVKPDYTKKFEHYDESKAEEAECEVITTPDGEIEVITKLAGDTYVTTTSSGETPVTTVTRGEEQLGTPPSGKDQLFCCSYAPGRHLVAVTSYHGDVHIARVKNTPR